MICLRIFDFHFLLPPYLSDQQYIVRFIDNRSGHELSFSQLSTGEKIIVNVILWSSSQSLGHHTKLFVLDEIDAHLHPAITRILMRALKEHVVERCGIQVIMSTHSPTTIAYADEASIFRISRDRTIQPAAKDVLIRELTDNFIAITNSEIPLLMDIGRIDSNKFAFFVEGPADYKIIQYAMKVLNRQKDNVVVIPAFGASTIIKMLSNSDEILKPYQAKGYIALIDYDDAYIKFKNSAGEHRMRESASFSSEAQQVWGKENNIFLMTLPRPSNRSLLASPKAEICKLEIEHLFSDEQLAHFSDQKLIFGATTYPAIHKKQKMKFAEFITTAKADEFREFLPLFDALDRIIATID